MARARLERTSRLSQRQRVPPFPHSLRLVDARREITCRLLGNRTRARIRFCRIRQHSPYRTRTEARRLRLGLSRVFRGVWRLDDLVRVKRGCRTLQHVPTGEVGRPLAQTRLARGTCLCDRPVSYTHLRAHETPE